MSTDPTLLVMSYRGNTRLDNFLQNCSVKKCLRTLIKLTVCLKQIHKRGVLHSDLKMDNVMVQNVDDPDNFIVNIIDFGLAQRLGKSREIFNSKSRHYPPESCCPGKALRSFDVYSLGILICHSCALLIDKKLPKDLLTLALSMIDESQRKRPTLQFVENRLLQILDQINVSDEVTGKEFSDETLQLLETMVHKVLKPSAQI
ncbi:hypothetical protein OTU49_013957 [Cherax quadricarinatus]|uniref:Protein kinase domain-containing protein n=1 Tax=Cherax quadricarinatus TaxID=27406 RepID=A0AAW0VSH5_CHEQU